MSTIHFTDITIRSLKQGSFYDDRTPGFGIRIGKRRRTWHVVKQPSRTKVTVGYYPDLSLADARKRALVALGSPTNHVSAPSFPDARDEYLEQGNWCERATYETTRLLNRYFPWTKTLDKISV